MFVIPIILHLFMKAKTKAEGNGLFATGPF